MNPVGFLVWRLRLAVGSWRGRGRRKRLIALGVGAVLASGLFLVSRAMFRELDTEPEIAHIAPLAVTAALHATLLFSLLRDTAGAMGHLFLSPDAGFLLASPLGPARVLSLKLVEAVADAIPAPAGTALPIVLAYGAAVGASPVFYVMVPLVFLLLLLFTVEVGFLLAFLLAPLAPPGRLRHFFSVSSTLLFLLCWLVLLWIARAPDIGLFDRLAGTDSWVRLQELLGGIPSTWAASELIGVATAGSVVGAGLLRLALVVGLFSLLLLALAPRYPALWQASQISRRRRPESRPAEARVTRSPKPVTPRTRNRRARLLPLVLAFAGRDLRLLRREPGMLTDMGVLVVMSALLPVLLSPSSAAGATGSVLILWGAIVFVAVELGYELGSRAFPLERDAVYWVLAAPLSPGRLLLARALSLWLLGLPGIALVVAVGTLGLGQGAGGLGQGVGVGWLLLGISVPVGLAAGVYLGRSDWRHPRQMLTLGGRMILLALLFSLAMGFWVTLRFSVGPQGEAAEALPPDPAAWALIVSGALLVAALCSWLAWRRLRGLEWLH